MTVHQVDNEVWEARRARIEAEQAAAARAEQEAAAAAIAEREALPVDDERVDSDPAVAELEQRIAAGDTSVTAEQLAEARVAAAGRSRFARLLDVATGRKARQDAEQVERDQAAAAVERAREALSGHTDVALVPLYDEAVAAVTALVEAVQGRNRTLYRLARLPAAERVRGVKVVNLTPDTAFVPLPEGPVSAVPLAGVVRTVLGKARIISNHSGGYRVVGADERADDADPAAVAAGRDQLGKADGAA